MEKKTSSLFHEAVPNTSRILKLFLIHPQIPWFPFVFSTIKGFDCEVANVHGFLLILSISPYSASNCLFCSLPTFFARSQVQKPLNISLLVIACCVTITVLVTLQFPSTMSSPWAALSFATCFTAVIGSVATIVGDEVAPLPLYALIMVTFKYKLLL